MTQRLARRYRLVRPLAKGGLGVIYEAFDEVEERAVAFKRLGLDTLAERHRARAAIAFEREYFTLAQLAHPRVIQVYDYGVDETGPYYTMELLDGVDLRERAPLPWRDACVVLRDVSSSLALLHSRHLLHHDLSPRNVRCTSDGHAKLIDFGAMGPFGPSSQLVGTPSYMAPEVVYGQALDGRADLFGLGALAYFALSRVHAFPPTRTVDLADTWKRSPIPLRQLVPGVPPALEALISSLLSLDLAARPSSAAEVASRLAAIADLADEDLRVVEGYLSSPAFTARDEPLAQWKEHLEHAIEGSGRAILVLGEGGLGRSRFLSVAALEAKLAGVVALHVHAGEQGAAPYSAVKALVVDLEQQRPDLTLESSEPAALLRASQHACLAILVDDFDQCDAASAAVFAQLALKADQGSLLIVLAVRTEQSGELPRSVEPIAERCTTLELVPFSAEQTAELLRSVFGDVSGLTAVAEWIQRLSRGNPGMAMDLAQHLVERGIARMQDGVWLLPESLRRIDLPESVEQAIRARVGALGPAAERIAQALALLTPFAPLTVAEIVELVRDRFEAGQIYAALDELASAQILVSAGDTYRFKDRSVASSAQERLDLAAVEALHRRLAEAYLRRGDVEHSFLAAHHLLCGGAPGEAYSLIAQARAPSELSGLRSLFSRSRQGVALHEAMVHHAEQIGESPRRLYRRRRALVQLAAVADPSLVRYAPRALDQLLRDTGLSLHTTEELVSLAPRERGRLGLERALSAWGSMPDAERGLHPLRALGELAMHAIAVCGVGSRAWDCAALRELPALLDPFVDVPGIAVTRTLVLLAVESIVAGDRVASQRRQLIAEMDREIEGIDTVMRQAARAAMSYFLGLDTAITSNREALAHADFVEQFPAYSALAWHVRALYYASSGGIDEMLYSRRNMELFAQRDVESEQFLQVGMVYTLLTAQRTDDLLTMQRMLPRVDEEAATFPGWVPWRHCFRGGYHLLRGELALARAELEAGLALVRPGEHAAWQHLVIPYLHVLVELGEHALAGRLAREGEAAAHALGMRPLEPTELPIALAWAEAHDGHVRDAIARIDRVLGELDAGGRGAGGPEAPPDLGLGRLHETRARLAIRALDRQSFMAHAALAGMHYRKLERPGLLARHQRLVERAEEAFGTALARTAAPVASGTTDDAHDTHSSVTMPGDPRDSE